MGFVSTFGRKLQKVFGVWHSWPQDVESIALFGLASRVRWGQHGAALKDCPRVLPVSLSPPGQPAQRGPVPDRPDGPARADTWAAKTGGQ